MVTALIQGVRLPVSYTKHLEFQIHKIKRYMKYEL